MNAAPAERGESGNPFSTRYTRPGAIAYLFPPGETLDGVLARLFAAAGPCEIIGPHGAGKSTLVATLATAIAHRGHPILILRPKTARLPDDARLIDDLPPGSFVFCDGYEQLGRWARRRLAKSCENRRAKLVVTAHESCGFTRLFDVRPGIEIAKRVVHAVIGERRVPISDDDIENAFAATGGNIRETLFALYDVIERTR
jgi:hypothetical protein